MPHQKPDTDVTWRELQAVLAEEVQRLPEKYRAPFVLCCLEGKSKPEAAQELGWKEGTVSGRLAQARKQLQQRLVRRGMTLSAVLCTAALSRSAVQAALVNPTIRAALLFAAHKTAAAGIVSGQVAALAEGVTQAMFATKVKIATVFILALGLVGGGVGVATYQQAIAQAAVDAKQKPEATSQKPGADANKPVAKNDKDAITVRGRVLDPDGKPLAGAKLYLGPTNRKEPTFPVRATTGEDGRFEFTFARSELDKTYSENPEGRVLAMAKNFGSDWGSVRPADKEVELTFRLVKDVAINGRILDPDGKPVAGAKVRVWGATANSGRDVKEVLEDMRQGRIEKLNEYGKGWGGPLPGQPKVLTTGADGRIRLTGFGRDRFVQFQIEGPGIATKVIEVIARPGEPVVFDQWRRYYGAAFDHVAQASRPIRGVVRDKATGKPVPGVEISAPGLSMLHKTQTDKEGRYELLGLPKSERYGLTVRPGNGQRYFAGEMSFADTPGLDPLTADIDLVSGTPLRGIVTDKGTGKPIAQARVDYHLLFPNPNIQKLAAFPGGYGPRSEATTGADGSFALVVLPGPGVLGVASPKRESYMPALVTPKDLKDFFKDKTVGAPGHPNDDTLEVAVPGNGWGFIVQQEYNALVPLDPEEKATSLTRNVLLAPARTLQGSVVGLDGKPLAGVTAHGLKWGDPGTTLKTSTFTVQGINPRRTRQLLFIDKEKKLGCFIDLKGDESGPLTIKLQPCGSATGRIVDKDGQPVPGVSFSIQIAGLSGLNQYSQITTGPDGRFKVEGLVPGAKYWAHPTKGVLGGVSDIVVDSGKNKDLGDVQGHLDESP